MSLGLARRKGKSFLSKINGRSSDSEMEEMMLAEENTSCCGEPQQSTRSGYKRIRMNVDREGLRPGSEL